MKKEIVIINKKININNKKTLRLKDTLPHTPNYYYNECLRKGIICTIDEITIHNKGETNDK